MKKLRELNIIFLVLLTVACGDKHKIAETQTKNYNYEPVMGLGNKIEGSNFSGDAWLNTLSAIEIGRAHV